MRKILVFILICHMNDLSAQSTNQIIDSINRHLDWAVVSKNKSFLEKHYADDFVFTHGTGLVDSKSSWIKNVTDTSTRFISREHDSVKVEIHKKIAIVKGQLTVRRKSLAQVASYSIKYIRVYCYRKKRWQLISHHTTRELHH